MRTTFTSSLTYVACAAVLLAGCSSSEPEEPAEPEVVEARAGVCVEGEVDDGIDPAPDFTTIVPCDEPHLYEVLSVVPIPEKFLEGETDAEKLAVREEYATPFSGEDTISDRKQEMVNETYPKCETPADASGMSDLEVDGKAADEIGLRPNNRISGWYNVTSEEQWLAGQTAVVCSVRYYQSRPKDLADNEPTPTTSVTSPDEDQLVSHYLKGSYPIDQRACTGGEGNDESVPCDRPHIDEHLFQMDMRALYGKDFLRSADLKDVQGPDFTRIIDGCTEPYEDAGFSVPSDRRIGFRFDSDFVDEDYLTIYCVLETFDDAPTREYKAFTS